MPLFLHQMDDLAARGCQTPGCTHEAHAGGLYLNQRCHPGAGVRVQYADDAHPEPCAAVLVLHCQRCAADVCSIALIARPALVPACQHTRGDRPGARAPGQPRLLHQTSRLVMA